MKAFYAALSVVAVVSLLSPFIAGVAHVIAN